MDNDIEEMVRLCGPCTSAAATAAAAAAAAKQPVKATLQSWPPTTKAWERFHMDLACPHLGSHSLIVVDAYHDVISVSSTTSRHALAILRNLWAQHAVPEKILSDKGMQFTSHEFREFCKANVISHILSPPYHLPIKWTDRTLCRNLQARPPQTERRGRCG